MSEEIEQLRKERDGLAARCERLTSAIDAYRTAVESGFNPSGDEIDDLDLAIQETPAASLAHVRAEAIEDALKGQERYFVDTVDGEWEPSILVGDLEYKADAIRQSASGVEE